MPITPYFRPQDTITQILRQTPAQAIARRNPVVIGPQHRLFLADGRPLFKETFTAAEQELAFKEVDGSLLDSTLYAVDSDSVKVMGEDLEADVATLGDGSFTPAATGYGLRLGVNLFAKTGTTGLLNTALGTRNVRIGDIVRISYNGATSVRTVVSLLPKSTLPTPTIVRGSSDTAGVTLTTIALNVAAFNRSTARTFKLTITSTTGAGTTITDVFGIEAPGTIAATGSATELGTTDATITLPSGTYVVGHTYFITIYPPVLSTTEFDGIGLDGPFMPATATFNAANDALSAKIYQKFSGQITVGVTNGIGASDASPGRTLAANAVMPGTSYPFLANTGKVYLAFKAVVKPTADEGPISLLSVSQISEELGELSLENWLGRGAFEAFNGNQKQRVFALRTNGDTVEAFSDALRKISTTDLYYALVPLSDKLEVQQLVAAHCEEMSNKYNKNFRRCYLGYDSPGAYVAWGALSDGSARTADLVAGKVTLGNPTRAESAFTQDDVGSTINFYTSAQSFKITQVFNAYECQTDAGTGLAAISDAPFTLTRADNAVNAVRAVKERAAAINNRRAAIVWSDRPVYRTGTTSEVVPCKFLAAEVAGLRCALLPQQGLTMTEIRSITAAPAMYTKFTPEQLDSAAADGVMVVTQESESGEVFIRHQLTTRTSDGALAYEDNVGVIVDTFSYQVKDAFRGYIGKRNVTSKTILDIAIELKTLADDATKITSVSRDAGPMIIGYFDEDGAADKVTVRPDSVLADSLLTYVKLRVPLPLNGLNHYVDVETSVDL